MAFTHLVVIDGERYVVPGDAGIDAVRAELLRAVLAGGGYVQLGRAERGYVEVLVTGCSRVQIEHLPMDGLPQPDGATGEADFDIGWSL